MIAKVGGSLFEWPELRDRLRSWLASQPNRRIVLIPGGGFLADAVRHLQKVHSLSEETAHWLAVRTMSVNAYFLGDLLQIPVVAESNESTVSVLDVQPFLRADGFQPGSLEHSWNVTSDSIAARFAAVHDAELTLLKSVDLPPGWTWAEAATDGLVDRAFPNLAADLVVNWVNLRT